MVAVSPVDIAALPLIIAVLAMPIDVSDSEIEALPEALASKVSTRAALPEASATSARDTAALPEAIISGISARAALPEAKAAAARG